MVTGPDLKVHKALYFTYVKRHCKRNTFNYKWARKVCKGSGVSN